MFNSICILCDFLVVDVSLFHYIMHTSIVLFFNIYSFSYFVDGSDTALKIPWLPFNRSDPLYLCNLAKRISLLFCMSEVHSLE